MLQHRLLATAAGSKVPKSTRPLDGGDKVQLTFIHRN